MLKGDYTLTVWMFDNQACTGGAGGHKGKWERPTSCDRPSADTEVIFRQASAAT